MIVDIAFLYTNCVCCSRCRHNVLSSIAVITPLNLIPLIKKMVSWALVSINFCINLSCCSCMIVNNLHKYLSSYLLSLVLLTNLIIIRYCLYDSSTEGYLLRIYCSCLARCSILNNLRLNDRTSF